MQSRRDFIKISGIVGGGLLLSTHIPVSASSVRKFNGEWEPNFFIRITADNVVTLISTQLEIGQGTTTGLSMILADELGADWSAMKIELAPGDKKYDRVQDTGGSNGIAIMWDPLRQAAAATREVLIQAAAERWNTDKSNCTTSDGWVIRNDSDEKFTFGELASEASLKTLPDEPVFKNKKEYKHIGKPSVGHKQPEIIKGNYQYSIDLKRPGMAYATIERSPVVGGELVTFDDSEARKVPGVLDVFSIEGNPQERDVFLGGVRQGVVILASSTWPALQAKKKLKITWKDGSRSDMSSESIMNDYINVINSKPEKSSSSGDIDQYLSGKHEVNNFQYINDFQVNACMEPLNAIADFKNGAIEIWAGTQAPQLNQERVAKILDLPLEKVQVYPSPSGGGFGRRFYVDYIEEAALISKRIEKPVKLIWSREDTISTNRYHDLRVEDWKSVLDDNKKIVAIDYHGIVSASSGWRPFPYDIPNIAFTRLRLKKYLNLPTSWRSVGAHTWVFSLESFMDEMAHKAGVDPLQFRLDHLDEDKIIKQKSDWTRDDLYPGRLKKALELVADKGNWGRDMPANSGQGIAGCGYNTSYCALMAEVTVNNGKLNVDRVIAAIDCGMAINPSQVKAQIEGSIVWGMSAVFSKIDIKNGRTLQSNFHDYQLPRIDQIPNIEVHIIENDFAPSGTGEPAVPVTAPAILNAIYAATGKRIRRIPIEPELLA